MDPYSGKAHGLRHCGPLKGRTQEGEDTSACFTLAMGCYATTSEFFLGANYTLLLTKKFEMVKFEFFFVFYYKLDQKNSEKNENRQTCEISFN